VNLTLETSGSPSRALWFILGAVSGFLFSVCVALRTLYVLLETT
jgi:LPS O-antigen subunit length determinant protein (WzzB/FepE family)